MMMRRPSQKPGRVAAGGELKEDRVRQTLLVLSTTKFSCHFTSANSCRCPALSPNNALLDTDKVYMQKTRYNCNDTSILKSSLTYGGGEGAA